MKKEFVKKINSCQTFNIDRKVIIVMILLIVFVLYLNSCSRTIDVFDQYAYAQTTSLKVDALNIMSLAVDDESKYQEKINKLMDDLQKIYEYEKGRPKNEITIQQWEILLDPNGHLLGGFIARWKNEGRLRQMFVDETKNLVSDSFDIISGLESGKLKPSDIK